MSELYPNCFDCGKIVDSFDELNHTKRKVMHEGVVISVVVHVCDECYTESEGSDDE